MRASFGINKRDPPSRQTQESSKFLKVSSLMQSYARRSEQEGGGSQDWVNSRNIHERDSNIHFDEPSHTYTIEGKKASISVTKFKEIFTGKFDDYLALYSIFHSKSIETDPVTGRPRVRPDSTSDYRGLTRKGVFDNWEKRATDGSYVHMCIEKFFDHLPEEDYFTLDVDGLRRILRHPGGGDTLPVLEEHHACLEQFLTWFLEFRTEGWKPYRTEWRVYTEVGGHIIPGSIDAVFYRGDGERREYYLIDWKRTAKDLNRPQGSGDERNCQSPFNGLKSTTLSEFTIQTNIYAYILKKDYGVNVSTLGILQIRPGMKSSKMHPIPLMLEEAKTAIDVWRVHKDLYDEFERWAAGKVRGASPFHAISPKLREYRDDAEAEFRAQMERSELQVMREEVVKELVEGAGMKEEEAEELLTPEGSPPEGSPTQPEEIYVPVEVIIPDGGMDGE